MKLFIASDIVPTKTTEKYFLDGNIEYLFTDVLPMMKSADRVVLNLECALTVSENRIKKCGPHLKGHPDCAKAMKDAGVTDLALSNNHVFDFGIEGLEETVKALDKYGINYMGIGENDTDSRKQYYVEKDGVKIGFVNVCEHEYSYATEDRCGSNPFDPFLTMHDIRETKKNCDYVIVLYHGGKEHTEYPSPRLLRLCREMVECGASVVLTQHSHCIGSYEEYEGGHILYGQGNFHFAHTPDVPENWYTSLVAEIDATKEGLSIKFTPIVLEGAQISIAKGEKAEKIMADFEKRKLQIKNGEWKKEWLKFCEVEKDNYDCDYAKYNNPFANSVEEVRRAVFAHFLDCEAHTDVLRELFPTWNKTNK